MATSTKHDKTVKELVLGKCWDYINENFHKFSQPNKIKVSLALLQKSMPTEIQGQFQVTQMGEIQKGGQSLVFNIG